VPIQTLNVAERNRIKLDNVIRILSEMIEYDSPPNDSADALDLVSAWLRLPSREPARIDRKRLLTAFLDEINRQFTRHDHGIEWVTPDLEGFAVPADFRDPPELQGASAARTTIGENIRRLRTECGLTQQQFADRAGVDKGTVGEHERGKTVMIRPSNLKAYADAFSQILGRVVPIGDIDPSLKSD
jgi:DNA-binding XRE family transcriptional regulator